MLPCLSFCRLSRACSHHAPQESQPPLPSSAWQILPFPVHRIPTPTTARDNGPHCSSREPPSRPPRLHCVNPEDVPSEPVAPHPTTSLAFKREGEDHSFLPGGSVYLGSFDIPLVPWRSSGGESYLGAQCSSPPISSTEERLKRLAKAVNALRPEELSAEIYLVMT